MNWQSPPGRLVIATLAVVTVLAALWQAGVLFQDSETPVTTNAGDTATLTAASTEIQTPPAGGLAIGLRAGDLAPNFEFSAFDGRRLSLADFRGRPVFLNFWASWCGPCRAEMPDMQTMLDLYGEDGLAVIGVNSGEALEPAQAFIDRLGVDFTAFAYDPTTAIVRLYAVSGLPVSYFIDADGVITRVVAGQLTYDVMDSSVREVIGSGQTANR